MKRKIAYVLHGLAAGGTEAFVINVVSNLNPEEYDITFILALDDNGKTHQFHEDKMLEQGIKIYRTCDLDGLKKWKLHYEKLKKILKEEGPFDVIHCNMDLFNGINLMAAKKAGIPVRICHSHNSESQYSTSTLKKVMSRIYRIFMRKLIYKNATIMLGCSELANDYLYGEKWRKDQRCNVLYNGIDLEKFKLQNTEEKETDQKKIMTIGRFNKQKNPFFLLEVLIELLKMRKDVYFSWIGDGELKKPIEEIAQKQHLEHKIVFLGRREDIPQLLGQNKYFLFPSLFEGLPITLIEAQASGLECFVSDTITREVNIGLCKYLSLKKSPKQWAQYISKEIDKKEKLSYDNEKLSQFDIKNTVKRLEEIYG
ncbi:glycosyltransferase [Anaerostipes faecalis]|uniref:glycosyltransferase n=1 Tax=Anaerostipes faecalis TaxID=2738446 RepID=UPI003F101A0C